MSNREIMWAELKVDFDDGPDSDNQRPFWNGFGDGDKQDCDIDGDIRLSPEAFPPGTKVVISVPVCTECSGSAEVCSCGYDWKKWVSERYS